MAHGVGNVCHIRTDGERDKCNRNGERVSIWDGNGIERENRVQVCTGNQHHRHLNRQDNFSFRVWFGFFLLLWFSVSVMMVEM